jgi:hypothetical protein|tara:strand:- start:71 stop:649 length:579 start_codon:yes stop_codon:yes gene_type:complete
MNDLIVNTSDWNPISWIPSTNSATWKKFVKTHGVDGKIPGCYQVALTKDIESIGDDVVHNSIGYTGKAKDVIGRTGGIRAPKGRHGARLYIDKNNLSRETDVVVRYLIAADEDKATELENFLHKESELAFGARFAWREASGGIDGKYDNILSEVEYLTATQMLDIIGDIMELSKQKALQEHEELILRKIESV